MLDHLNQTAARGNAHLSAEPQPFETTALPGVTPEPITDTKAAMSWFANELDTIQASVRAAAISDAGPVTWQLPLAAYLYCQRDTRFAEWRDLAQRALEATIRHGDRLAEAHIRRCLSGAYHFLGDMDTAEQQLLLAAEIFDSEQMTLELGQVNGNLSAVALRSGRPGKAMDHARTAVEQFRAVGHPKRLAGALWVLGHINYRTGRFADADQFTAEALEIFTRIGDATGRGSCLLQNAMTAHIRGDLAEAHSLLEQAIGFTASADDRDNLILSRIQLGMIELEMGDRDSAAESLRQALAAMDVSTPTQALAEPRR
jgi:tetratricopeptide (TPR) repeat protein